MTDDDFKKLLEDFIEPEADPNPDTSHFQLRFVRDNPAYGSFHMHQKHQVSEHEVREVLLEIPPTVECRHDPDHPERKLFFGATRKRRQLLVVCDVEHEGDTTILVPITAFDADETDWRKK